MVPKIGVAPISQFLNFLRNQQFDCLPQLFLKEPGVKTHTGEHCFGVIEHVSNKLSTYGKRDPRYNDESTISINELKENLNLSPQLLVQRLQ